jgi:acyl-coenzyme A synthetase/AMP-(fatty) acid ligase
MPSVRECGLISHANLASPVAYRAAGPIPADVFLRDVAGLASALPTDKDVFNLCEDRYRFAVTFAAVALAGRVNLLPQNRTPRTLQQVVEAHPASIAIADGTVLECPLPVVDYEQICRPAAHTPTIPAIAPERIVALVFTSGSTGAPKPNTKRWGHLAAGARAERAALGLPHGARYVGTVPPQHMYGFESTVLLPLLTGGAFHVGRPLYAGDIAASLRLMPAPRVLITAPLHIRACLEANVVFPEIELIVSAAAPLAIGHAKDAEQRFRTIVREIYGFTEAGMVAVRRTVEGDLWNTFPDVQLIRTGDDWSFGGGHVEGAKIATDRIDVRGPSTFRLDGRRDDIVNVAGKRASLTDLSLKLTEIPGVVDGVFHFPEAPIGAVHRPMAFVVAPGLTERAVRLALRGRIDATFLPRPLIMLDHLPRAASGKLPLDALQALEREYTGGGKKRESSGG